MSETSVVRQKQHVNLYIHKYYDIYIYICIYNVYIYIYIYVSGFRVLGLPLPPRVGCGSHGRGCPTEINDFSKDSLLQSQSAPEQFQREYSSLQLMIC